MLQDCTNQPLQKRSSKAKAESTIHEMLSTTPRGNPTTAVAASVAARQQVPPSPPEGPQADQTATNSPATLCTVFRRSRNAFDTGAGMLMSYIQRNASYEVQKAVAVSVMATAMTQLGCSITHAAQIASECTQLSQETVHRWANCYFVGLHDRFVASPENVTDEDIEEELSSERGHSHSSPSSLIHNEAFQLAARSFVREHAYIKGEPNLTVCKFAKWVNTTYSTNVHPETARRWLYKLGFSRVHHQKGLYFDGHDRSDVQYRNHFLATVKELDKRTITFNGSVPHLQEGQRPLIRVVHNESTFHANCDQSYFWGDESTNVLRQKSVGAAIMVSDFIDEVNGFVRDETDQARLYLETQKEGYFNNDHLLQQVKHTIDIFERVHPNAQGLFLFDNAPSHKKVADDALNVDKMNVHPGGMQPKMRSTTWEGRTQTMVYRDGTPKGMKAVLEERGVDTRNMKAPDMREKLKSYPDFQNAHTTGGLSPQPRPCMCILPQIPL